MKWKPLDLLFFDRINQIGDICYPDLPETPEIFRHRIEQFPEGCRMLIKDEEIVGYGIAYPWELLSIPPLDSYLKPLPKLPLCMYIHDVAILPEARGHSASKDYVEYISELALSMSINFVCGVSVHGTSSLWKKYILGCKTYSDNEVKSQLGTYGFDAVYMIRDLMQWNSYGRDTVK